MFPIFFRAAGMNHVITSYSIHYTKLYEIVIICSQHTLRSWVRFAINLFQSFHTCMRIDLCRAERCVPQKLLPRTEVRTGVEQVRRETVPQAA